MVAIPPGRDWLLPLLVPGLCPAAKVKVWHHHAPSHYDKAQFKHAVVSSEGALRLSREVKPLAGLDATHVWDVVEDRDGNLYVATGDEGKLYKVTADGKASVVYTSEDSQILCLAAVAGRLRLRRHRAERPGPPHRPEGQDQGLLRDSRDLRLVAGRRRQGRNRLRRHRPQGPHLPDHAGRQGNVSSTPRSRSTSSAWRPAPDGTLYAGTDKGGLVYRIDAKGKGFVSVQAPQAEVRRLLVTADGVYAGTSSPTRRRSSAAAAPVRQATSRPAPASRPRVLSAGKPDVRRRPPKARRPIGSPASAESKDREGLKGTPLPRRRRPPAARTRSTASPRRHRARGLPREALVLSLLRHDGRFFVGTGMDGQLFEVDEATKERSEIARLDHGQILCLLPRRDGSIVLGTGDPGKLYVLQDRYAAKGTVTSEVLDAKLISKWGALRWKADTPAGTAVTVAVRSGNVAEPDDTWSDWSAEQTDPQPGDRRPPRPPASCSTA